MNKTDSFLKENGISPDYMIISSENKNWIKIKDLLDMHEKQLSIPVVSQRSEQLAITALDKI